MKKIRIFILFMLFFGSLIGMYLHFLPILRQTAEIEANRIAQKIFTQAANNALKRSGADLSFAFKENSGKTDTLSADMSAVNLWKEYFIEEIENDIKNSKYEASIPFGTLLGNAITYGKGPNVKITVVLGGYINADIKTKIESAGINQSKYSIYASISSKMYTYLPFSDFTVENNTDVYLAEYVTIGEVPSVYRY